MSAERDLTRAAEERAGRKQWKPAEYLAERAPGAPWRVTGVTHVQGAAGNAFEDHWWRTRNCAPGRKFMGRLTREVETWLEEGRRPEQIVTVAILLPRLAQEFERAFPYPPTDSTVQTAMLETAALLIKGDYSWRDDVLPAVAEAARRGDTFIDRAFNDLMRAKVARERMQAALVAVPAGRMFVPHAVAAAVNSVPAVSGTPERRAITAE